LGFTRRGGNPLKNFSFSAFQNLSFSPMPLVEDIDWKSAGLESVRDELVRGELHEAAMAQVRQRHIAESTAHIERKPIEGLGQLTMQMDAGVYHRLRTLYGPDCFADPKFRARLLRDNPELRPTAAPAPTRVTVVRQFKNGSIRGRVA
jgi:hypothetical protein